MAGDGKQRLKNIPQVKSPPPTSLVTTIVEQGPRDDQMRVDAFGHVSPMSTSINNVMAKYVDDLMQAYGAPGGGAGGSGGKGSGLFDFSKVEDVLKKANEVITKDIPAFKKRIEDSVLGGRTIESVVGLALQFKDDKLGALLNLADNVSLNGMKVSDLMKAGFDTYEDARSYANMIKNNDWKSFQGIVKGLDLLGHKTIGKELSKYIDLHATSAFLGNLLNKSVQSGNTKLVSDIRKLFQDDKQAKKVLNLSTYNAATRGDIGMVKTIVGLASEKPTSNVSGGSSGSGGHSGGSSGGQTQPGHGGSPTPGSPSPGSPGGPSAPTPQPSAPKIDHGPKRVGNTLLRNNIKTNNPNLIQWLAEGYKLDSFYEPDKIEDYRHELLEVLETIDPQWYYDIIGGEEVTKLEPFVFMSDDAKRLLKYNKDGSELFLTEIMIANTYPEEDIKQMVMKMYDDITYKDRPLNPHQRY
nr:MAG TPA: Putative virion structural protein [Caudoviricetes sp.]